MSLRETIYKCSDEDETAEIRQTDRERLTERKRERQTDRRPLSQCNEQCISSVPNRIQSVCPAWVFGHSSGFPEFKNVSKIFNSWFAYNHHFYILSTIHCSLHPRLRAQIKDSSSISGDVSSVISSSESLDKKKKKNSPETCCFVLNSGETVWTVKKNGSHNVQRIKLSVWPLVITQVMWVYVSWYSCFLRARHFKPRPGS